MNGSPRISRRNLLATAAIGAGTFIAGGTHSARADAPLASPGSGKGLAMLRWGIIGTGTRGAFTHIPALSQAPDSQLLALCDISEERLQINGDEGTIESIGETFQISQIASRGTKKASHSQIIELLDPPSHGVDRAVVRLYEDFLACVQTGKKPDASPARALAASRTCWLAELASERRAEVKWDELGGHRG